MSPTAARALSELSGRVGRGRVRAPPTSDRARRPGQIGSAAPRRPAPCPKQPERYRPGIASGCGPQRAARTRPGAAHDHSAVVIATQAGYRDISCVIGREGTAPHRAAPHRAAAPCLAGDQRAPCCNMAGGHRFSFLFIEQWRTIPTTFWQFWHRRDSAVSSKSFCTSNLRVVSIKPNVSLR